MNTLIKCPAFQHEPTRTERAVIVAQINDRLERYLRAVDQLREMECVDFPKIDPADTAFHADAQLEHILKQYQIPEGVFLITEECYPPEIRRFIKPIIPHWVAGRLDAEYVQHVIDWSEGFNEYDYGWVFLNRPMWFYMQDKCSEPPERFDEIAAEMIAIGSRSKQKWPKQKDWY